MRVRSSAASASDRSARAAASAASGRVGAGRLSAASALRRLARAWSSRSLALLTASRALSSVGSLAVPARRALSSAIDLLAGLHQLALGVGDAVLGRAAVLGRLAGQPRYCRARACAPPPRRAPHCTRPISSSSSSRTSRSPAATLSLSDTSTSAMRPGTCAPMRTSPPAGSTRPGAEAAHADLAAPAFGLAVPRRPCRVVALGGARPAWR